MILNKLMAAILALAISGMKTRLLATVIPVKKYVKKVTLIS
jgi:hypothetical protein